MHETVFTAYFETEKHSVCVCYEPGENGEIFITSVSIELLPVTLFEQSHAKRRRGIVLDDQEQHAEAMLPTTRREKL